MPATPALAIHTGDITHLSKPEEFDHASQLLALRVPELHTVPGEHDVTDGSGAEYFGRFGKASDNRGYYSFDHAGVHFIGLVNVMHFAERPGSFGDDQLAWLAQDLKGRSSSTPIVVFSHMPMWTIYEPWAGAPATRADDGAAAPLRLGHRIERAHPPDRVEGRRQRDVPHRALHRVPATDGRQRPAPVPLTVPRDRLPSMLGVTTVEFAGHPVASSLRDATLA